MLLKCLFLLLMCIALNQASVNYVPCSTTNSLRIYGSNPNQGMLQICADGYWKSVCGHNFNCNAAKAACRQLGFTGLIAYYPYCCNQFGAWSPKHNYYWSCSGTEHSLSACSQYYQSYCWYSAGIYCHTLQEAGSGAAPLVSSCADGDVRLVDGEIQNALEGRVEICSGGDWHSVCNLPLSAASVICKQLGHTRYASFVQSAYGSSSSIISSISCNYDYNHLNECTINVQSSFCNTATTLPSCSSAIQCYPLNFSELCQEGSIRLVGGDIVQEGRLEFCFDGVWGGICPNGWDTIDSYVACKQMGYDAAVAPVLIYSSTLTHNNGPVLFSNVYCQGFEKTLTQCSKSSYPISCSYNYYYYNYNYFYADNGIHIRCYDDCVDGDVKLVGGQIESEGTVEICRNNLWGLLSDIEWGVNETRVVCRQLGFQTQDVYAVHESFFGRPDKTVHYSHTSCTGAEDRLTQCSKTMISLNVGKTTYKGVDAAGVSCHGPPTLPTTQPPCIPPPSTFPWSICTNDQIRLFGGQTAAEGILEYCYNGQWSHFCTLRPQEATVACKEMGFTQYSRAAIFTNGQLGSKHNNYSLFQNINCESSELALSLSDCTLQVAESCLPSCFPIGIRCYESGSCEEGAVRLMDGIIQQEGRVEVCSNGVWGSVCDQNWNKIDAHIICLEIGYPKLEPVAYHNSYFGDGYGPILYSNVTCNGWEQSFTDCTKTTYSSFTCSREQIAGVLCGENCNDGDIRLVGGASIFEGTVEICFGNLWGLIAETGWGDHDAEVVCRQLEYNIEDVASYVNSHFGKPNKTIHASDVTCLGEEESINDCTMTTYELEIGKTLLNQVNVVGVSCAPNPCIEKPIVAPACTIGNSIRLTGGATSNEGTLEYCYKGTWTPACSIGLSEATVACRQLGFADYAWATVVTFQKITTNTNSSYYVNSTCNGAEFDLNGCSHQRICSSTCLNNTLTCYDASNPCTEGSVRLTGGTANKNGRVEVCYNGVWGTVCGNGWSLPDAIVVCKQLGLTDIGVSAATAPIFGESNWPIVYSDVACGGWETNLLECTRKLSGSFQCANDNLAGVICSDACSDGDVRLVGGAVTSEGTVEICSRSVWGMILATGWTNTDAAVVCDQLGYSSVEALAVVNSTFGKLSRFVHLTNVQCGGAEETIFNCSADVIPAKSSSAANNFDVAGVICRNESSSDNNVLATNTGSETALAVFVGIFSVVIVAGGFVIAMLILFMYKMNKSIKESVNKNDSGAAALLKDNPVFGVDDNTSSNY